MDEGNRVLRALVAALIAALATFASAATAAASTGPVNIPLPTDDRNDIPSRPGQWTRVTYGPYTVNGNSEIKNAINLSVPANCTNCRITDMIPDLIDNGAGNSVNLDTGPMLHHFVLIQPGKQDVVCPNGLQASLGQRFFAAGNERTHMHLPLNFGYDSDSSTWRLIYHIVNKSATAKTVNVEVLARHRPKAETQAALPAWFDVDGCLGPPPGGDSDYTIPQGYSNFHDSDNLPVGGPYTSDWTLPWDGKLLAIAGHSHDVDITGPGSCYPQPHCVNEGGGIAVSAELLGGSSSTFFGPLGTGDPSPADLTGATLCRSKNYYGTPFSGGDTGPWRGHLDTMSQCGIFTSVPGGAQPEVYPPGGAYPANGVLVSQGQTIRLHSEYQNDTGFDQIDAMGIMMAWFAQLNDYARPGSATPLRVPLVPEYKQCTSANRTHVQPLNYPSCSPSVEESSVLTTSTVGKMGGFAKFTVVPGNVFTPADEANVGITATVTDVRKKSDGTDYVGKVLLTSRLRLTDRQNGPAESGTVRDTSFNVPLNCVMTTNTTIGATCSINTTADALVPNTIIESKRMIMSLLGVQVRDAGANGTGYASCPPTCGDGDEKVFLGQGVFAP